MLLLNIFLQRWYWYLILALYYLSSFIGSKNDHHLNVNVDTTNPSNVFVECTFFQPEYTCTIAYGTDPSYTNLTAGDTSLTHGQMATIILSQRIMTDTNYYYIVSARSSSQCVRVRGRFRTGRYMVYIHWERDIKTCLRDVMHSVYVCIKSLLYMYIEHFGQMKYT